MISQRKKKTNSVVKKININLEEGTFKTIFKKIIGDSNDYNISEISNVRRLLNNQKARILHIIKIRNPSSIYELTKILHRDFRTVKEDLKLLQKFGFIDLIIKYKGKRKRLNPI